MEIKRVTGMYFSATGTTEKIVKAVSDKAAEVLTPDSSADILDFTLPDARSKEYSFGSGDLVVIGTPTYAGRVPNVLLPFLKQNIKGSGAICIPVVLFGNRDYDDSLIELSGIMKDNGLIPIAGGAFVGEHAFSYVLGAGRPDEEDIKIAADFAEQASVKIRDGERNMITLVTVKGEDPVRPYYTPRDRNGNGIDIRKVRPVTGPECDRCGTCAEVCPMGSISFEDPAMLTGICIKCGACVKKCPKKCKYFDDEKYLYHKTELEEIYKRRAEDEVFL